MLGEEGAKFPRVSRVDKLEQLAATADMTVALLEQVSTGFYPDLVSAVTGTVG